MAITALKAWYLEEYEPIRELEKRPHDLRLSKNSLLKSGLRADFLEDSDAVKQSAWFQHLVDFSQTAIKVAYKMQDIESQDGIEGFGRIRH